MTLTESDLVRIINRVINEGLTSTKPLKNFPDGIYKLEKVSEGTEVQGPFLKQEKGVTRIYTANHKLQKNGSLFGGGQSYSTGGVDSTYDN